MQSALARMFRGMGMAQKAHVKAHHAGHAFPLRPMPPPPRVVSLERSAAHGCDVQQRLPRFRAAQSDGVEQRREPRVRLPEHLCVCVWCRMKVRVVQEGELSLTTSSVQQHET